MMEHPVKEWTAIVLTSRTTEEGEAIKCELLTYQKKGLIHQNCVILVVEDPISSAGSGVGSGTATINALFYAAEQLSARRGFHVLSADVLTDSNILVLHHGRSYPFGNPLGAFTLLPKIKSPSKNHVELTTNILNLYNFVTSKYCTDMIIDYNEDIFLELLPPQNATMTDACIVTVPAEPTYASKHGVVLSGQKGLVRDLLYRASESTLLNITQEDALQLISGIVYMSVGVSERLLALQRFPAIESCTYLSTDVGTEPHSVSFFFDMLLAMSDGISEEDFMKRGPSIGRVDDGGSGDASQAMAANVRKIIWNKMRHFRLSSLHIPFARHIYVSADLCAKEHLRIVESLSDTQTFHSFVDQPSGTVSQRVHSANSCLINIEPVLGTLHVTNSFLDNRLQIDGDAFLYNVDTRLPYIKDTKLCLNTGLFLAAFPVRLALPESTGVRVPVVIGLTDALLKPVEQTTYCNVSWKDFLEKTGITTSDLWPGSSAKGGQTLWNAKIFPVLCSSGEPKMDVLFWAFTPQSPEIGLAQAVKLERWRASWRYSLCDILQNCDLGADFQAKRSMFYEVFARQLDGSLLKNENMHYLPYFQSAVVDGYSGVVLEALDIVASTAPPSIAARTLALTADMLSCMAKGEGGLRSGPAANEKFLPAFDAFENGDFERGVRLMRKQRDEWSFKPDMLIRCARHYEGAAQICIRRAVSSAKQFISLKENVGFEPSMDQWYVAECPARLDLSGGWTDTPPITYENGGTVVNVAILIDGKRPIGAKVRRTESLSISLLGDGDDAQVLSSLNHFRDYCIPNAPGALLKACFLLAEIVCLDGGKSLEEQLRDKWKCGFEVVSWSNLPQGSGLGTSSILAAAIIAALWSATGRSFDNMALIHAVLCVEQMLTTGGGWQDQVGGVFGGVKVGSSLSQLPLQVSVQSILLNADQLNDLNSRLLVIYTGKPRLAKNLLQNVVRSWYSRDSQVVSTCESLKKTAQQCAQAFQAWDYETVCTCISSYYEQKKCMAAGTEPASVRDIIRILLPYARVDNSETFAGSLAGAGGGGFLYCLLNDPNQRETVCSMIKEAKSAEEVQIFPASIDTDGLKLYTVPVSQFWIAHYAFVMYLLF